MVYAVIDTNVLVSAALAKNRGDSIPLKIFLGVAQKKFTPIIDNNIIEEYRDVLQREAFYHDAAFVALDCLVQALGDPLEFYAEVVVDARADGFLRLVGVFGIGVLEREFALVLETGVNNICE